MERKGKYELKWRKRMGKKEEGRRKLKRKKKRKKHVEKEITIPMLKSCFSAKS